MVVHNKKGKSGTIARNSTARILVLGDKNVGKSASIVRFTTGRYIQDYCGSTDDWLYRHRLDTNCKNGSPMLNNSSNNYDFIEMLEQKDIQFLNSCPRCINNSISCKGSSRIKTNDDDDDNNFSIKTNKRNEQDDEIDEFGQRRQTKQQAPGAQNSLASRVAMDQQIDNELHEKQQLLNKLHWANAYVVIYSINDISSFNKAIKYLNLIANNINCNSQSNQQQQQSLNQQKLSSNCSGTKNTNNSQLLNRFSPLNNQANATLLDCNCHQPSVTSTHAHGHPQSNTNKRPVLLLANKKDLEKDGRQVPTSDGLVLAMRHQAVFAELSIADSRKQIETNITSLMERINPGDLHIDLIHHNQQRPAASLAGQQTQILQWIPTRPVLLQPIWASIVKSKPVGATTVQSCRLLPPARPQEAEVRLLAPITSVRLDSMRPLEAKPLCLRQLQQPLKPMIETTGGARIITGRAQSVVQEIPKTLLAGPIKRTKPNGGRYESFKLSFKKASMAIVSSGVLAKSANRQSSPGPSANESKKKDSFESAEPIELGTGSGCSFYLANASDSDTSSKTLSLSDRSTNWIKSHMKPGGANSKSRAPSVSSVASVACSDPKLYNNIGGKNQPTSVVPLNGIADRFKKPLFRYRSRRKTVAFDSLASQGSGDEISAGPRTDSMDVSQADTLSITSESFGGLTTTTTTTKVATPTVGAPSSASAATSHSLTRCSSGRSSSSLSTTDNYYNNSIGRQDQANINLARQSGQQQQQPQQNSLKPTRQDRVPSSVGSAASTCSSSIGSTNLTGRPHSNNSFNSRSTLSRASTSGGSFEESCDDDQVNSLKLTCSIDQHKPQMFASSQPVSSPVFVANSMSQQMRGKQEANKANKRYQLVKTVQSTINSLTRTGQSNSASSQPAATKSFCKGLFRYSAAPIEAKLTTTTTTTATPTKRNQSSENSMVMGLAKVERIPNVPFVGFCK